MKVKQKIALGVVLAVALGVVMGWYLHQHPIPVLQPAGIIASKERNLMVFCVLISAIVVIPVFGLLWFIGWRYRETNTKAKYSPELDGNRLFETLWWLVPGVILVIISVVTWRSSYALDPFKPLASSKPTLHVQVVALDWKWLFIYPKQNVASVNEAAIPVGTPVDFEVTSDSVMTSFWVPQLGSQIYAMPGMATQVNLLASRSGNYYGEAANISGQGFAGMKFSVKAMDATGYDAWVKTAASSHQELNVVSYNDLSRPSEANKVAYYASVDPSLYDNTVMKYMMPLTQADAERAAL